MTDLIVSETETKPQVREAFFDLSPRDMMAKASEIATELKKVIQQQKLSNNIGGKEHVRVEGWTTLGAMLGILPREKTVTELSDGSYEASVELYSLKSGQVVGGSSALCGVDEKRWRGAEKYARRSMATTRATGKAYRLGLGWIMTMAGYEVTPLEEMPYEEKNPKPEPTKEFSPSEIYTGTTEQKARLIKFCKAKKIDDVASQAAVSAALIGRPIKDIKELTETL